MSSKPVVVQLLPAHTARKMFRESDLARLREIADVRGPVTADDPAVGGMLAEARAVITGWGSKRIDSVDDDGIPHHPTRSVQPGFGSSMQGRLELRPAAQSGSRPPLSNRQASGSAPDTPRTLNSSE